MQVILGVPSLEANEKGTTVHADERLEIEAILWDLRGR